MNRLQDQHELLQAAATDLEVCLSYLPGPRRYGINQIAGALWAEARYIDRFNHWRSTVVHLIYYCPWSGRLLPSHLRHARNRTLRKEGFPTIDSCVPLDPGIPREFINSEDWWVRRGIDVRPRPGQGRRTWKPGTYAVMYRDRLGREPPPGYWRSHEAPPHLCRDLANIFDDIRFMITYIPWTREYGFRRLAIDRLVDYQPIRMMKFDYCPLCGTKLPDSLKQRWLSEITAAGHDPNDEDLPPKFLSDTWWKELGL